MGNQSG